MAIVTLNVVINLKSVSMKWDVKPGEDMSKVDPKLIQCDL